MHIKHWNWTPKQNGKWKPNIQLSFISEANQELKKASSWVEDALICDCDQESENSISDVYINLTLNSGWKYVLIILTCRDF